jgi:hypothetical protein
MNRSRVGVIVLPLFLGLAACPKEIAPEDADGDPSTDALMMADNTNLTWGGDAWLAAAPGAAANLVMATATRLDGLDDVSENCKMFRAVISWDSVQGVTPIVMRSSLQTGTANWTGSSYVISGLLAIR